MARRSAQSPLANSEADGLAAQLERRMAAARPRLMRLARAQGLSPDSAEDVVQETLLEAWRHLDRLYDPDAFDAWLGGICRNICRRRARSDRRLAQRQSSLPRTPLGDESALDEWTQLELADSALLDPAEELERQDLEALLDRALGYLPPSARGAVELCYLAGLPQREAAQKLGFTIRALEARLRRARQQLRQVLRAELRAEAEAFGLALDQDTGEDMPVGWRQTRLWCPTCGRQRLDGAFEPLGGEQINLHLRCPGCLHEVSSWGHVPLGGMCAFRPAYKRVMQHVSAYFQPGLASGWLACLACGAPQPLRIARADELGEHHGNGPGLMVVLQCVACARHQAEMRVVDVLWSQADMQQFMGQHPRSIAEPETLVEHQGQPAIRVRLTDISSAARLTLLVQPQTLHVLATVQG